MMTTSEEVAEFKIDGLDLLVLRQFENLFNVQSTISMFYDREEVCLGWMMVCGKDLAVSSAFSLK
jgi:hypothetical protein